MTYTCMICNNSINNKNFKIKGKTLQVEAEFTYFQCSNCGCLQIAEIPYNIELYYPSSYYSYFNKCVIPKNLIKKHLKKKIFYNNLILKVKFFKIFINKLLRLYPDTLLQSLINIEFSKQKKILDVGCGNGSYLYFLKELKFENLLGIDPFISRDIIYENNLIIKKMKFEDVRGKWDIIMFHHSLEHISNQKLVFSIIFELLNKNGVCIIRIPTVSSYAWRHYGVNWVQIDPPRHFFLHSIKSILYLCKLHNLHLEKVIYDSTDFQFWGTEQSLRNISLDSEHSHLKNPNSVFTEKQIKKFRKKARRLNKINQGDQAIFYICKK